MALPAPSWSRTPPALYRVSRWFRRLALIVVVILTIFLATVGYSAYEFVSASPQSGGYSASFASNSTVAVTGDLSVANHGWYPLSGFDLSLRIRNASGDLIGTVTTGPETLAAGATTTVPIALYLPISPNSSAASLLVTDQYLAVGVWGNATYAYLFPISVHFEQNKSWGAPFANLAFQVGAPSEANGSTVVPVTVSFSDHAPFAEDGRLGLTLRASNDTPCGSVSYGLDVPSQGFFYQTENVVLSRGCSLAGGSADAVVVLGSATIPLPPETLP